MFLSPPFIIFVFAKKIMFQMKIIHTSDWHLGHVLYNLDRQTEHEAFLRQLCELVRSEKPDALLVSGDIFDSAQPSIPAQRLYNRMMIEIARNNPGTTIVVTAGNHDGASRQELFSVLWDEAFNVKFIGKIGFKEDGSVDLDKFIVALPGKGFIVAVPYIYGENYPESTDEDRVPIQDFHQRLLDRVAEMNREGLPVIMMDHLAVASCDIAGHDTAKARLVFEDLELLGRGWDYLALGHIHKPQTLRGTAARYCGSPIPVSFDEDYEHSVSIVTIGKHGDKPGIATVPVKNVMPIWNLPGKAGTFDEVKSAIAAIPAGEKGYARVNIKVKDILPMEQKVEIEALMKEHKGIRLCNINVVREGVQAPKALKTYTPDELKQSVDAVLIAKEYYSASHDGEELPEELVKILESIVREVENKPED